jgi:hypothetical protein
MFASNTCTFKYESRGMIDLPDQLPMHASPEKYQCGIQDCIADCAEMGVQYLDWNSMGRVDLLPPN